MQTKIRYSAREIVTTTKNQAIVSSQITPTLPTYSQLTPYHLKRVEIDCKGNKRPKQSLENERSAITNLIKILRLDSLKPVGEELGVGFSHSLAEYRSILEDKGLAEQTIKDRLSIIRKLRESFLEYQRTEGLPQDFSCSLRCLIESSNISPNKLSKKIGVDQRTLLTWTTGEVIPHAGSLPKIRELEKFFKIPEGTLSSRIPDAWWVVGPAQTVTTPWRKHQEELVKLRYRLPSLTERLQEEWGEIVLFFTDEQWLLEHGLKRNSEWRVRWNNGRCVTAEVRLKMLLSFFGYLCLPTANHDKRLVGLGLTLESLTLAQLSNADLVIKYLHFMKARSVSNSFNLHTLNFLTFCLGLLRKKTGFLRQRSDFSVRLSGPIATDEWASWCRVNRRKLLDFREMILKSKKHGVRMTRNPFEPVIEFIKERQHPISALFDLASKLEALTPLLEKNSKELLAVHHRNIFQVQLISSNPLRVENFSMMTFIPKDYASFDLACESFRRCREKKQQLNFSDLFVEATSESNLYQRRDGSWHLRFNERDFKNERGEDLEKGMRHTPYDVSVVPSVWPSLVEYLFRHRTVLNESLRDKLALIRAAQGLPPLTPEEELLILRCPYVFRPSSFGMFRVRIDQLSKGYCTAQISTKTLSEQILALTSKYLPNCKGFGAHACRHLVATEYIKNHPNGYEEAAAALHNTQQMIRKHYAWVEIGDRIKPWSNYYEELKGKYDRGEI